VLGVNLWGVIHGIRAFLPAMLAQDTDGHVVNTASVAGLLPAHPSAGYQVTKHAVVALSEHLYCSLRQRGAKIGASVLCPGWVRTRILEAERNRPARMQNASPPALDPALMVAVEQARAKLQAGSDPASVADVVFRAIREDRFYVFTDGDALPAVRQYAADLVAGRNPSAPSPA
jgi:NAD(P)-dependent dehydrogenase (short-subunit alcohol dehydrogenase family)